MDTLSSDDFRREKALKEGESYGKETTTIEERHVGFPKAPEFCPLKTLPIYTPYLPEKFKWAAKEVLDSGMISSQAPGESYVRKCENFLQEYLGVRHCILVNNGTSATHLLILAVKKYLELKGKKLTKIYIPNNVYVACYNVVLYEYPPKVIELLRPAPDTWNFDTSEEYLMSLEANSVLFVVHNIGNIVDVPRIAKLRPDLIIIEDCCEGFLGKYTVDGKEAYAGTSPATLASSISFFPNKIITSGEGGAFISNDEEIYQYIKRAYNTGMTAQRYRHDILAYNYRITNLQAAILYPQLSAIDEILKMKERVFNTYRRLLGKNFRISFAKVEEGTCPGMWIFCIRIGQLSFSEFEEYMKIRKIDVRPFFYPVSAHDHLKGIPTGSLYSQVMANFLHCECVMLPSYPELEDRELEYISESILKFLDEHPPKACGLV